MFMQRAPGIRCEDFQVFGERGSGTNFLTQFLRRNLKITFRSQYGWKHGIPVAVGYRHESLIAGIYRDPIDWLVSLFQVPRTTYAAQVPDDFSQFIRSPFMGVTSHNDDDYWRDGTNATVPEDCPPQYLQLDRHPITGQPPATPMHLRNFKLASLLGFKNRVNNLALIQYEHLKENRRAVIERISTFYDLPISGDFDPIEQAAQPKNNFKGRPKMTRDQISDADMAYILDRLDLERERALGYDYPEP
ncbi:sulfotransferase domain-containing protein [Ponticoccus sp. SC2-23]|uniref:sulfotransferase domain-containing protein n=1 Tax=Alexandriicola marinus TaxID=2081710 RepID=UPI000FDA181E|nr:sulfotransferase domain-containing protein [Alexandriicola marinus]MBM1220447.1 sulfotransferase domain-containing protein [Ponticoccus sp. SC6-9]MBM1225133.1 sulfotransferase domain-containing protein [Ponticoccus sp. SC6-15]MBM1228647.1 sulfotransferase domain-containing protein [Ponticoccus sp. SC6-38]MBM1233716.1 sulfotransferase domain-containing protein [Ponticoccus sp. SC6-45]MBM1239148.1 sulfotransferase domain-containing protein [Ponticoccus sp. SC6-49]MBM1242930.1 sulfotransferas